MTHTLSVYVEWHPVRVEREPHITKFLHILTGRTELLVAEFLMMWSAQRQFICNCGENGISNIYH